jgi:hypothetical protein
MTETDTVAVRPKPGYYKVRVSHPVSNKRTVFRSINEKRARTWLMNHNPRGEEFYLEHPDGSTESYVLGRQDEDTGDELEHWQPFNPEEYLPPEMQAPPGDSGWPDLEG